MKPQRIRDPLHDLVEFSATDELEIRLWESMQTQSFQRLRRVKQLGFSDLVYPGATHSRFAHSVGVFHIARQLMEVVRRHSGGRNKSKEDRALAAALLHDLGHGPFSHAFEKVGKRLGLKYANHEDLSDALIRRGEVSDVLNKMGSGFATDVADIIRKDGVRSVEHAVVSSQFDADRLDYMRRDRLMTGTQHSAIDFKWLIANLEIGKVNTGVDENQVGSVETFVLGPKAIHAAEAFVLGLFQLYPTVYLHKATRGAELIFVELLIRVVQLARDDLMTHIGLGPNHPLLRFAREPDNADVALSLDDTVVWGALSQMVDASDRQVKIMSGRLRDRKLYKCFDVRDYVVSHEKFKLPEAEESKKEVYLLIDKCCAQIEFRLDLDLPQVLIDKDARRPYKSIEDSHSLLNQIHIRSGGELVDLKERSRVVGTLRDYKLLRAYFADSCDETRIKKIVEEEIQSCKS